MGMPGSGSDDEDGNGRGNGDNGNDESESASAVRRNASQHASKYKHVDDYVRARNEVTGLIRKHLIKVDRSSSSNSSRDDDDDSDAAVHYVDAERVALQVTERDAVVIVVVYSPMGQHAWLWEGLEGGRVGKESVRK